MQHVEQARAKVNLTLRVLGRRADGYHELESLVVFADIGDTLTMAPADRFAIATNTPDVADDDNLVRRAAELFFCRFGRQNVRFTLDKRLPIAAGIGGGSADAAATLRLLARTTPAATTADLETMARALGADVPVCLASRASVMRGTGERFAPVARMPALHAVLANARGPVPARKTAAVFQRLAAPLLTEPSPPATAADADEWIRSGRNDLEAPATILMPEIDAVLGGLHGAGATTARLSGAGPTCFGLFPTAATADAACVKITRAYPTWWVTATRLG